MHDPYRDRYIDSLVKVSHKFLTSEIRQDRSTIT